MPMMPRIDTSTRRVEIMPEKHYARSVAGEIGRELGSAGRALGGAMERIDAVREREAERQRVLAERNARAADADARRSAELNDALAENFIANAAVGREVVDESTGERRFVPGKFAKTWSEMKSEGMDSVKLTREILSEMREQEWYRKMDPAVRSHFDRKFLFTRDRWMRRAAENDMKARQADRIETMKSLIAERARGVEGVYGADDATFLAAATRASFQNFLDLESSAIENVDQFDDVQITAANAKEVFSQIKWRENISDEEKVKKYNRILAGVGEFAVNRITALTKAAAKGQGLGAMDAEQCLQKAGDIADGLRETFFIGNNPATGKPREILTEVQHGAILGEIEVARRNCEGIKAYELRKKREDKIRDVVKSELSIRDVPQEQWANNYETLGRDPVLRELDPQRAMRYLDTARDIREAEKKAAADAKAAEVKRLAAAEKARFQAADNMVRKIETDIEWLRNENTPEALAKADSMECDLFRAVHKRYAKGEIHFKDYEAYLKRRNETISADERRAMVKIDRAFGLGLDVSEGGNWSATDRKAWLDENSEFEVKVGDEMEEYEREEYLALRDRVRRRIKEMGKDISRSEVVDDIIASIKREMASGKDFKEIEAMAEQFSVEAEMRYRSEVISR